MRGTLVASIILLLLLLFPIEILAEQLPATPPSQGTLKLDALALDSPTPSLARVLKNLGIVLGLGILIIGGLKYRQTRQGISPQNSLRVISRLRLSSKSSLMKVQDGEAIYTFILGEEGTLLLSSDSAKFSQILERAEERGSV
jgi:hypothetical protein